MSDLPPGFVTEIFNTKSDKSDTIVDLPQSTKKIIHPYAKKILEDIRSNSSLQIDSDNSYRAIKVLANPDNAKISRKVKNCHQDVQYFANGALDWHLDHYTYFEHRDHINYLICYMPIYKPRKNTSNLDLIPYDKLLIADEKTYHLSKGRGAMRLREVNHVNMNWFLQRFPDQS